MHSLNLIEGGINFLLQNIGGFLGIGFSFVATLTKKFLHQMILWGLVFVSGKVIVLLKKIGV
jgi:hypothetical protein